MGKLKVKQANDGEWWIVMDTDDPRFDLGFKALFQIVDCKSQEEAEKTLRDFNPKGL